VKLQVLNLATKLCITNPKQTKLLCQYVLNLAKYDQNYDIRDRSRFLRQMVMPGENGCVFSKYAKKIFLAPKPAPVLASKFKGSAISTLCIIILFFFCTSISLFSTDLKTFFWEKSCLYI
jgi:hypothetical protein